MSTKSIPDITGQIGELFPSTDTPKFPMYSYSRPAYLFWQGFYRGLRQKGATHKKAMDVLQSKAARHLLDGDGDQVEALGQKLAEASFNNWVSYVSRS